MSIRQRTNLSYVGAVLIGLGLLSLAYAMGRCVLKRHLFIDFNGPILLLIGGIVLYHDSKRCAKHDGDPNRSDSATHSRVAKAAIIVGGLLIVASNLFLAGSIAFLMLAPLGP